METPDNLTTAYNMIYLLSCSVNCVVPEISRVQSMELESIRKMSRFHSLSSTVYIAVEEAGLGDEFKEVLSFWEQEQFFALFREETFNSERDNLLLFCEENSIWYMPLKGVILKDFYPHFGMRQMGDNDILFDENYREQIHEWFVDNDYEVENYKKGNHDVYTKDGITFEMHTELFGVQHDPVWRKYYAKVKERLIPDEESICGFHFSDDDFYIYLTVHEYKHYCEGGAGLRFLLDDYVFLKAKESSLDWEYIERELNKLGAAVFENRTRRLCRKLFSGSFEPETLTTEERELLVEIVSAGTFGTVEGHIKKKIESNESGSKLKYAWKRLFPDIRYMREYFPMCKYPVLIPFAYVYRIVLKLVTNNEKLRNEIETLRKI